MVHLPDGSAVTLDVGRESVISEILKAVGFASDLEFVVFTGPPSVDYATPVVNLGANMGELNMYHLDKHYMAELSVHYKSDESKYNVALYAMYMAMPARVGETDKIDNMGSDNVEQDPVANELR
jgi:hypothetical protein